MGFCLPHSSELHRIGGPFMVCWRGWVQSIGQVLIAKWTVAAVVICLPNNGSSSSSATSLHKFCWIWFVTGSRGRVHWMCCCRIIATYLLTWLVAKQSKLWALLLLSPDMTFFLSQWMQRGVVVVLNKQSFNDFAPLWQVPTKKLLLLALELSGSHSMQTLLWNMPCHAHSFIHSSYAHTRSK